MSELIKGAFILNNTIVSLMIGVVMYNNPDLIGFSIYMIISLMVPILALWMVE